MKNNVICIFVDSVSYSSISTNRAKVSPTPFIDSLKRESITAANLYSHGPYTDAAIRSLFTGRNCLDDFGYYFRLNTSPINDFKLFHDAGYETYGFYYPFIMHGKDIKKCIDHTIYTSGFVFGSEWGGMFKYYSLRIKETPLSELEYLILTERFKLLFDVFESYLKDLINSEESKLLYKRCLEDYNVEEALLLLQNEYAKFERDTKDYIDDFLAQGENHILWKIDTTSISTLIDINFLSKTVDDNKPFFDKVVRYNYKANILKTFPSFKRLIKSLLNREKGRGDLAFLYNYKECLTQINNMFELWEKPDWQVANSTHSILKASIDVIKKRPLCNNRPFYMNILTEDTHNYLAMFAYDIQDKDVIYDEINVLNDYLDKLGTNFEGSLLYLLSLRYVDYEIEKFCKQLKEIGLWDNTTLMIVSDHGSSYTYFPLHSKQVNCFDDECYHVPITIRHPGLQGKEILGYRNSKDIYPTVCDLIDIPKSPYFKGNSMIDKHFEEKPYVLTEYMGPGCPDILHRRIWMSIRDRKYIIAYKVGIYENFEDGEISECYNLQKDPEAYYNICSKIDKREIAYLLEPLKNRFEEIKIDSYEFINELKNNKYIFQS